MNVNQSFTVYLIKNSFVTYYTRLLRKIIKKNTSLSSWRLQLNKEVKFKFARADRYCSSYKRLLFS